MGELLGDVGQQTLSPAVVALHFAVVMILSFILRAYYLKLAKSLASRIHIANTLPLLAGITFLVICVVKSSLALSLGLVGALSIVRFRTPIKEPEELAYIFLAMAIGLGCAAGEIEITVLVFVCLLIVNAIRYKRTAKSIQEYFLHIDINEDQLKPDKALEQFIGILTGYGFESNLEKIDAHRDSLSLTARLPSLEESDIQVLLGGIKDRFPNSSCSIFDSRPMW